MYTRIGNARDTDVIYFLLSTGEIARITYDDTPVEIVPALPPEAVLIYPKPLEMIHARERLKEIGKKMYSRSLVAWMAMPGRDMPLVANDPKNFEAILTSKSFSIHSLTKPLGLSRAVIYNFLRKGVPPEYVAKLDTILAAVPHRGILILNYPDTPVFRTDQGYLSFRGVPCGRYFLREGYCSDSRYQVGECSYLALLDR